MVKRIDLLMRAIRVLSVVLCGGCLNVNEVGEGVDDFFARRVCPEDGNPCTRSAKVRGRCTHESVPDGTPCGGEETCQAGACEAPPPTVACVVDVAAGYRSSCLVKGDGTTWCWGGITGAPSPSQVVGLGDDNAKVALSTYGSSYGCALKSDGTVWCWGYNVNILGDNTWNNTIAPGQVSGLTAVADLSLGYMHNCAVKADGTVWCWGGDNGQGLLGENAAGEYNVFAGGVQQVAALGSHAIDVENGLEHSCATLRDRSVWCWGCNSGYELGVDYGVVNDCTSAPFAAPSVAGVLALSAARDDTYNIVALEDGSVRGWGSNAFGNLGDGQARTYTATPVTAQGLTSSSPPLLAAGMGTSFARASDGSIWGYGFNKFGELGTGTPSTTYPYSQLTPVEVATLGHDVSDLAAGSGHSCVVLGDGTAACWGQNWDGQLGDGTTTNSASPVRVAISCP
jgi:alpha-tubulin suppressor-like RCC1 family protein